MKFNVEKRFNENKNNYASKDFDMALEFAKKLHDEFGDFIKTISLFGSIARKKKKTNDIDVFVLIDDISIVLTPELQQTYRIIVEKIVSKISLKLHITTMRFSSFWEYVRGGDPIIINVLRDGFPLLDKGVFEPLQYLLKQGRLRPTEEAIYAYFSKAPITLKNSKWHILQATMDLYWAVTDSAHAVLMRFGQIPPTPAHIADLFDEILVSKRIVNKKYTSVIRRFYNLSKMILHREIKEITGSEYEKYLKEAEDFVEEMKKFLKPKKFVNK